MVDKGFLDIDWALFSNFFFMIKRNIVELITLFLPKIDKDECVCKRNKEHR